MNKEQNYTSDTDDSDEDFRPDNLAGELSVSEDEEADSDSETPENHDAGEVSTKRKTVKVVKKRRAKRKHTQECSDDDGSVTERVKRRNTRQTEVVENGRDKTQEKNELVSDDEDKTRTEALWADFLKDVNPTASSSRAEVKTQDSSGSEKGVVNGKKETNEQIRGTIDTSKQEGSKKAKVTEVLDFAGEEVRIEREVDASSIKENKAAATQPIKKQPFGRIMPGRGIKRTVSAAGSASGGSLGSLINQLGKKKKLSVLEKSQMDWNNFKQTEGIDEQLQTFNKGKDGYLERQDFLQRTDLRQFEIEKNLRQSTRRPL